MTYRDMHIMYAQRYLRRFDDILQSMTTKMKKSERTPNITLDFISEMIPHHEGAIEMSKNLLQYNNIDPKLRKLAENIICSQSEEIKLMEEIRKLQK